MAESTLPARSTHSVHQRESAGGPSSGGEPWSKDSGIDGQCWDTPDDKWHAVKSQGGIISPVLANCALDGLQHELETLFATVRQARAAKVNLVRYADDCVPRRHEREVYMN